MFTGIASATNKDMDSKEEAIRKVKEHYKNYITDELVNKYQELLKNTRTLWELKEVREQFIKEHSILT
jgi:hypothetical protein